MKTSPNLSLRAIRPQAKSAAILHLFILSVALMLPVSASAATTAGITPGSFWYFFDTASEKISLFFTFNPENKAKKALEYADERLAEIDAIAGDKNPDAVKAAIADYEGNVALATEKSKEVTDKGQAESLLNSIESSASKNQETLSAVLIKVPEEARAAITQAIEASKKGQEEAVKQIADLKGEVEKLKQEVAELKAKDEEKQRSIEELSKKKTESPTTPTKSSNPQTSEVVLTSKPTMAPAQTPKKITSIVTLPNGAIVEMGAGGNITRIIKEAPTNTTSETPAIPTTALPATQITPKVDLEISSVKIKYVIADYIKGSNYLTSLENPDIRPLNGSFAGGVTIEWETSVPTESKIFILNDQFTKPFQSKSGLSTRHSADIFGTVVGLQGSTVYDYEIEAIAKDGFVKRKYSFKTPPPLPLLEITPVVQVSGAKVIFRISGAVDTCSLDIKKSGSTDYTIDPFFTNDWGVVAGYSVTYSRFIPDTQYDYKFVCKKIGYSDTTKSGQFVVHE